MSGEKTNPIQIVDPPLRLGSTEDFRLVAAALRVPGFDEATIKRVLDSSGFAALDLDPTEVVQDLSTLGPQFTVLTKLFVQLEPVAKTEVEKILERETLEAFVALDLLREFIPDPSQYCSSVFLCPVGDILIASDQYKNTTGVEPFPSPEWVYPAIRASGFVKLMPKSPAENMLDLCSGAGICALALSKQVMHIVASDITDRSTHFARFNSLLNERTNIEVVKGDLFNAVDGQTFDRIVAHPPYMPTLEEARIWRDGGPIGDAILRRIIEQLPIYLRSGGTYVCFCLGIDSQTQRFEDKIRSWLGDNQNHFDVIFAAKRYVSPKQLARELLEREPSVGVGVMEIEKRFVESGASVFAYGALALQKHGKDADKPWTLRTELSGKTDGSSFEFAFGWNRVSSTPEFVPELSRLRPRLASGLRVRVTHTVQRGKLFPAEFLLEADWPFLHKAQADSAIISVMARFNGVLKVSEVYTQARADGTIPKEVEFPAFASMIAIQITRGYLTVPDTSWRG